MNRIIILSGLSGSGKSTAIKALEDIGYFCVDNLPPDLLLNFLELTFNSKNKVNKVAIVIDIRIPDKKILMNFPRTFKKLKSTFPNVELVFIECLDDVIISRYKETRRKHPLQQNGDILSGIKKEKEILSNIKEISDYNIDSSEYNVHQLKEVVQSYFSGDENNILSLNFQSFGYKHGYPIDADLVFDVRFLPNPYFISKLKDLDGNHNRIKEFVLSHEETRLFLGKVADLLKFLIPEYKKEGKSYLNVALGCTGGKHRSVVIVNELAKELNDYCPKTRHRDIIK